MSNRTKKCETALARIRESNEKRLYYETGLKKIRISDWRVEVLCREDLYEHCRWIRRNTNWTEEDWTRTFCVLLTIFRGSYISAKIRMTQIGLPLVSIDFPEFNHRRGLEGYSYRSRESMRVLFLGKSRVLAQIWNICRSFCIETTRWCWSRMRWFSRRITVDFFPLSTDGACRNFIVNWPMIVRLSSSDPDWVISFGRVFFHPFLQLM